MNPLQSTPSTAAPVDEDLAKQAQPGHGVPSQDPNPAAQSPLQAQEAEREATSVLTAGGAMAGAATGAAVGVAVAGPVGVVVGATLGVVAGALGGAAAGAAVKPELAARAEGVPGEPLEPIGYPTRRGRGKPLPATRQSSDRGGRLT